MLTGSAKIAEVWNSFSVTIVNSNLWDRYSTVRLESQSPLLSGLLQVTKADLGLMLELFANISTAQYCEQQSSRQHRHKRTTYPDSSTHQRERTQNKTNLPQHDVTVLIHTCDAYSHLWKVSEKKYCLYKMCLNCD